MSNSLPVAPRRRWIKLITLLKFYFTSDLQCLVSTSTERNTSDDLDSYVPSFGLITCLSYQHVTYFLTFLKSDVINIYDTFVSVNTSQSACMGVYNTTAININCTMASGLVLHKYRHLGLSETTTRVFNVREDQL